MSNSIVEAKYQMLFDTAVEVLQKNGHPVKHTVGAAVQGASGKIYVGVNLFSNVHGVCAELIAIGATVSNGEKELAATVAVANRGNGFIVLSPCGNCRQMLLDYAPQIDVIYADAESIIITKAKNLLPGAYISSDFHDS